MWIKCFEKLGKTWRNNRRWVTTSGMGFCSTEKFCKVLFVVSTGQNNQRMTTMENFSVEWVGLARCKWIRAWLRILVGER